MWSILREAVSHGPSALADILVEICSRSDRYRQHTNRHTYHNTNKKHLKNVGSIRHNEPPIHQMSLAVLSRAACASMSTTTTTTTTRDRGDRYGPMEWAQSISNSWSLVCVYRLHKYNICFLCVIVLYNIGCKRSQG